MSLLHKLLPHHCSLCLSPSPNYICHDCLDDLPKNNCACDICGLPLANKHKPCSDCIKQPKPYTLTLSPLLYSHPVDHLIHQFKARTPQVITQQLAPFLHPLINHHYTSESEPDTLIPVPLHWHSKFKRGFNQAHCLADYLSSMTGIPCAPVVHRQQRSLIQKSLDRKRRLLNLRGSFNCPADLTNMHVVIVDDVVTTCATVINMANILLAAGAKRVDVWAFARTPRPNQARSPTL